MGRERLRPVVQWSAVALVVAPLLLGWLFTLYTAGSAGPPSPVRALAAFILAAPVLAALAVLLWQAVRDVRRGDLATGQAWPRIAGAALGIVATLAVVSVTIGVNRRQPPAPDSFYNTPAALADGPPGSLLRSEPLANAPAGAIAWKLLYRSTRPDGALTAASATLTVPNAPAPAGGRPLVAWAHGTVGVARNCAPSLRGDWPAHIDGLERFLQQGYAVVATDYQGMGTSGANPYLVGESAAMDVLNSVRAAHAFAEASVGTRFAVWGASQGGHSALFTGEFAAAAPELTLVGVAAAAPPTDLAALFDRNLGTTFGNVLATFAFVQWSRVYPGARLGQIVAPLARPVARAIASYCIQEERQSGSILPGALVSRVTFLSHQPKETEPWRSLVARNSLGDRSIAAPVLITQGDADPLVRPDVTAAFVARRCAAGEVVELRRYPGVGHVPAGPVTAPDVAAWLADRFAGKLPTGCR